MKRLIIALLAGCAGQQLPDDTPVAPEGERKSVIIGREAFEQPSQLEMLAGSSFPEEQDSPCDTVVESRDPGSFTAPGRRQILYIVHEAGCGFHVEGWGKRTAVIIEAREIVSIQDASGPVVATMDLDEDGVLEWVEATTFCNQGWCVGELRIGSLEGEIGRVENAYEASCGPNGDGLVRWTETEIAGLELRTRKRSSRCR